MARGIWKGNISFGLVTVPVSVVSAENRKEELDFDLIDKRDQAHVGYQKINKKTGEPIENENIVKGLKIGSGKYAIFDDDELKKLRIKGSNSIEIQQFIGIDEVDPIYFKKFYYLEPTKDGEKTYVLLRETLRKTGKFAVGLIVMHSKQQLVLVGTLDEALVLYVVHYASEIKKVSDLNLPPAGLKAAKITPKEISMAERLVEELSEPWNPRRYKDEFMAEVQSAVKTRSRKKVEASEERAEEETSRDEALSKVLDLMPLLEKSLAQKGKKKPAAAKPAHGRH